MEEIYCNQWYYKAALRVYKRGLTIYKENEGEEGYYVAVTLNQASKTYYILGDYSRELKIILASHLVSGEK